MRSIRRLFCPNGKRMLAKKDGVGYNILSMHNISGRLNMLKRLVWILAVILLFQTACAETVQTAPDYVMEGYDGDLTYRVWDTNLFFSRMQEKTGISFQFRQYKDLDEWGKRKKELLEGTDLPDVLFKAELNQAEVRDMYQAGYLIDLSPYLEQYAPDLWKLLEEHPEWKKAITLENGAIPALPGINTLQNNDAMWINTAWLKKLKLNMPATAEELTEVLRAFRDGDPNGNMEKDEIPLTFIGMWELRFLAHAFGIIDNDWYISEKDGKVTSSLTSDQNRAFLTWLHQLWTEGLIDHSGFTNTDSIRQITDEKKVSPYGVILSSTPLTVLPETSLSQYSLLVPLTYDGRQIYRDMAGDLIRGTFAVTSACKEPEKLVAWVNELYKPEGYRLACYGQEGEDYLWNEDGYWEWSTSIETVANEILPTHTLSEGGVMPGYTDPAFQLKYRDEKTRNTIEALYQLKSYSIIPYPPVTLSAEDEARAAAIQKELSPYAEQTMARFVTGDIEMTDENWQIFCDTVNEKGLPEMAAIWQNALK